MEIASKLNDVTNLINQIAFCFNTGEPVDTVQMKMVFNDYCDDTYQIVGKLSDESLREF